MRLWGLLAALAAWVALAPAAFAQGSEIKLSKREAYKHPHTSISVPAELGGVRRTSARAYVEDDLNLGIAYDTSEEALTVYIYRVPSGGVPVWFAQAQYAIETRAKFRSSEYSAAPEAFIPPGQSTASGLRVVYALSDGDFQSTGLAMFALGDWYVKLRASSRTRSPEELAAWMAQALGAITVPAGEEYPVQPVEDCPARLTFEGLSKDVAGDTGASALAALITALVPELDDEVRKPVTWCRDRRLSDSQALYRPDASETAYMIGLGDSGVGVTVARDLVGNEVAAADGVEADRYTISLVLADRTISFRPQDRLPPPQRVVEIVNANQTTGSVNTWGDDKTINLQLDRAAE